MTEAVCPLDQGFQEKWFRRDATKNILLCTRAVYVVYWSNPHRVRKANFVCKPCFKVGYII